MLGDLVHEALTAMRFNRRRTSLTMLGMQIYSLMVQVHQFQIITLGQPRLEPIEALRYE